VFHFRENTLLLLKNESGYAIPTKGLLKNVVDQGVFLFEFDGIPCFLIRDLDLADQDILAYYEVNFLRNINQGEIDWVSVVAFQLRNWYAQHRFCGICGAAAQQHPFERAVQCTACNHVAYPTISPAIIVALKCKNKLLLARGVRFPEAFYSLVAGYTDVGETVEQTVAREVKEEVGLDVWNVKYYGSQPWPYSGSMMLGFIAEADDTQPLIPDPHEIADAGWFTAENLPSYPPARSIAGEMIEKFKAGIL